MGATQGVQNGCAQTMLPKMEVSGKGKKAGGVGWSARVWQLEEGGPRAPEKVGWVADRSFNRMSGVVPELKKDMKVW